MGQDLTGADLSGHDLRNIDFTNTIIRGSNLSNTNLQGVDMSEMDLRGINFSNANLKDVNFTDAIFSKTIQVSGECNDENPIINVIKNFKCISVVVENEEIRTNFKNADLTNVKFGSDKNEKNQMVYFVDFTNANLTNVDLYSVHFFGNNFTDAKLNGISGNVGASVGPNGYLFDGNAGANLSPNGFSGNLLRSPVPNGLFWGTF